MAPKSMKRALSKAGGNVAKKCKTIAATIRSADDVPIPVRSMICDTLVRTFSTYKEERHAYQKTAAALVGDILKKSQGKFQAAINEANNKNAAVDAEAATFSATNDAAVAAADAAANALAASKAAVAESKTALKDAKSHLHNLETEVKTSEAEATAAATKKEKLEVLSKDFLGPIKDGTQHGAAAGKHVTKVLESSLEPEFLACVTRTFSKASSTWGTFDNIVDQRLAQQLKTVLAGLASDIDKMAADKEVRATNVVTAEAAIGAALDRVKVTEDEVTAAAAASKEADAAAKTAGAAHKQQQQHVQKATDVCADAEKALNAFTKGALAAYTEVEARAAPPPPAPEAVEETVAPQVAVAAVMAPAPAVVQRPSMLPSPAVLFQQARNLLPTPRVAQSPRVASSPTL